MSIYVLIYVLLIYIHYPNTSQYNNIMLYIRTIFLYKIFTFIQALPWSFKINNSVTGTSIWSGYCVDFTSKIAEMLNFNYEFVEPNNGTFGEKINGIWDGVIGDLVTGVSNYNT